MYSILFPPVVCGFSPSPLDMISSFLFTHNLVGVGGGWGDLVTKKPSGQLERFPPPPRFFPPPSSRGPLPPPVRATISTAFSEGFWKAPSSSPQMWSPLRSLAHSARISVADDKIPPLFPLNKFILASPTAPKRSRHSGARSYFPPPQFNLLLEELLRTSTLDIFAVLGQEGFTP